MGKRIEPRIWVELNEGDMMQIGGSSRVYRLHWVQLSQAFDIKNPFVLPSDLGVQMEDKDQEGTFEVEDALSIEENRLQFLHDYKTEGLGYKVIDENSSLFAKNEIPSAPPFSHEADENKSSSDIDHDADLLESLALLFSRDQCSLDIHQEQDELPNFPSKFPENGSSPDGNFLSEIESPQWNERQKDNMSNPVVNLEKQFSASNIWSRRGKLSVVLPIQTGRIREKSKRAILESKIKSNEVTKSPFTGSDGVEEATNPYKESRTPITVKASLVQIGLSSEKSKKTTLESEIYLSEHGDIGNNEVAKRSFTDLDGAEEAFTPDKENYTPNTSGLRSTKQKEISKHLFSGLNEIDEPFTPDKENFTPNTLLVRSMLRMSKMKDIKGPSLRRPSSSQNILAPPIQEQKLSRSSSKNETKSKTNLGARRSTIRFPFQPLFVHSSGKGKSEASPLKSTSKSHTMDYGQAMEVLQKKNIEERTWHMVADTTCLLNKDSRKALQLLQGLKGTHLIIPAAVKRKLDSMNRQGSLFKRKTEVSRALEWIEECVANTNWWIHVQNSEEEARPIASTPPATPKSALSEVQRRFFGVAASLDVPYPAWGSLIEIVSPLFQKDIFSPLAEDYALECALLLRRVKNDSQFVLVSNDASLKIKAMAEGLMCETADEFHESLVNPFSKRFLWKDSSPRGLTWTCMDDIVLKETFYGQPLKTRREEGLKGLKLVLLHNDRYASNFTSIMS